MGYVGLIGCAIPGRPTEAVVGGPCALSFHGISYGIMYGTSLALSHATSHRISYAIFLLGKTHSISHGERTETPLG